jgi:hypothetical protein
MKLKSKEELLLIVNKAIISSGKERKQWFVRYSGRKNSMSVTYYHNGWLAYNELPEICCAYLYDEEEFQELYWFIKNRLK